MIYNVIMRPIKPKKAFSNRPVHLKMDDSFYFFTVRAIEGQWFLRPDEYKRILKSKLIEKTEKFGYPLIAYVILPNHYHFIVKIGDSRDNSKFIGELNGSSARVINRVDGVIARKIWWNYYDHIIRGEEDFFKHLNYIHQNPIKHGMAKTFEYEFSSYNAWVKKKGIIYLNDAFERYPIVDFVAHMDDF